MDTNAFLDYVASIYSRLKLYNKCNESSMRIFPSLKECCYYFGKFKCRDNCFFRKLSFIIPRVKGASHAVLTPCITVNNARLHLSDRFLARDTPIDLNAAINQPHTHTHTQNIAIHEIGCIIILSRTKNTSVFKASLDLAPFLNSCCPLHIDIDREDGDERASCEIGTKIQQPVINAHGYPPSPLRRGPLSFTSHQPDRCYFLLPSPLFPLPQVKVSRAIYRRNEFKDPSRRRGRRRGPGKGGVTVESRPREKGCDTLRYSPLSYCYDERVFHCHASSPPPSFPFVARWTGIGESL